MMMMKDPHSKPKRVLTPIEKAVIGYLYDITREELLSSWFPKEYPWEDVVDYE